MKVHAAEFLCSATGPEHYPRAPRPEVAIAGRSNVGKSSLINALLGRRSLARTSGKPGHTRTLNFIDVTVGVGGTRHDLRLCDLPGYGFAKVSQAERRRWRQMIESYLEARETLALVVSIVDARHAPSDLDRQLAAYLSERRRAYQVVATKIDKVPRSKRKGVLDRLARDLSLPSGHLLPFSAVTGEGRDAVWSRILDHCFPRA
ncbi:MAG: YihA family ribosome biogenesis GTP-binding protein [Deltaproteobacteria bacterium]|nr:MAG: YihA family ribosome biogenesis GTP-binding protein [Deltaproteobacteria bacterium]